MVEAEVSTDGTEQLVEGSSSEWLLLEGGSPSSSPSDILLKDLPTNPINLRSQILLMMLLNDPRPSFQGGVP